MRVCAAERGNKSLSPANHVNRREAISLMVGAGAVETSALFEARAR